MSCKTNTPAESGSSTPCQTATKLAQERARNRELLELLESARQALSTCRVDYSEYNQFEGEWNAQFDETLVGSALAKIHQELGLPAPTPVRKP